jgi:hypothetical protein
LGPISLIGNNAPSLAANAPKHAFQEDNNQTSKDISIGCCCYLGTIFQGKSFDFLNLYRFRSILTQSFQDTSATMGTSSVTSVFCKNSH